MPIVEIWSSLIQVRFRSDLSESERDRAIGLVRRAVAMPEWKLPNGKGTYVVTGAPVVVSDLTRSISHSLIVLLIGALVVMALTLALVFRARLRLLPLVVALAAAGLTFGALSLAGASLTMASIAVLPVLIGLAVDYAIQLQARVQEAQADGAGIEDYGQGGGGAGGGIADPAGTKTTIGSDTPKIRRTYVPTSIAAVSSRNACRATAIASLRRAVPGRSAVIERKIGAEPSGFTIGSSAASVKSTAFA